MNYFTLIITVLIYFGIIAYLGWLGYKHTSSAKDYMLAGGEVHPYLMAMGYGSTQISTSAIVGFGGAAAMYGMSMLWLTAFNVLLGIFIGFTVVGTRTRAMGQKIGAQTFPEFLGKRYNSEFIRKYMSVLIIVAMPLYAAAVMIGGARFLEKAVNINYSVALVVFAVIVAAYVLTGGLKSVLYTSAFQGTLMLTAMTLLIVFTYAKLGGITAAHQALANMADQVPPSLVKQGHLGWTSMPALGSQMWWFVLSTLVLGVGIGTLSQPQLSVRFMTVKSNRELYRALLPAGVFILMMIGVATVVGTLSNAYFMRVEGKIAAAMVIDPIKQTPNIDNIIPVFITTAMPELISYIFLLTLLAAAMSTLAGQFHLIATSLSYDLYKPETKDDVVRIKMARYAVVAGLLVTLFLGFVLPGSIIAIATAIFFGLCAASFLPMYLAGLFWKRATVQGGIAGMLVGSIIYIIDMLFIYTREASIFGVCRSLFGVDSLASFPWIVIDPIVLALPASVIVTVLVSLITKPVDNDVINNLFGTVKVIQ